MATRVKLYFEEKMMEGMVVLQYILGHPCLIISTLHSLAHADMDTIANGEYRILDHPRSLPHDPQCTDHSGGDHPPCAWGTLYAVLEAVDVIVSTWSQLLLIASVAHSQDDGWLIVFICMAKPLIDTMLRQDFWSRRTSTFLICARARLIYIPP